MNPIAIAAQGKGLFGTLKRAGTIRERYGLTAQRTEQVLAHFVSLLQQYGSGATFPIPAATLARSNGVMAKHQALGIEFAAHGYYHKDHTRLSFEQQLEHFSSARTLFKERGIRCDGFRAPYLRASAETLEAVRRAGFVYDTTQAIAWEVPEGMETPEYQRALGFYGAISARDYAALPSWENDLVRIPYCLPDDEAFVDRFEATPSRMAELWLDILKRTYARGELFTVGLHPERILHCELALVQLLEQAHRLQPCVWMTQLYKIAEWWKARAQSAVSLSQDAGDEIRVTAWGPEGLTLLARHVEVSSAAREWGEGYVQADGPVLAFRASRRPFIGVAPGAAASLVSWLRQQGYIVEESKNAADYFLYLDRSHFAREDERPLLDQIEQGDFPLVRLGRWPNGARSALCVTGDIDALTIWDYALRLF